MSEFNTEDLDEVIASTNGSLVQMLALQLKNELAKNTALTSQLESVVAENAVSNDRLQKLIQIINNADNSYCMCGDAMESHAHGGCGHPTGMFDYHYNKWLESENETPATSAFLAEVRASAVEKCAEHLLSNDDIGVDSEYPIIRQFAAQLRQGGAV